MHPVSFSISPPSQLLSLSFFSSPPSQLLPHSAKEQQKLFQPQELALDKFPLTGKAAAAFQPSSIPHLPSCHRDFWILSPFPLLWLQLLWHTPNLSALPLSVKYSKPSLYLLRSDEGNQSLGSGKQNLGMTFSLSSVSFDGLKGCSGWRGNRCI